MIGFCDCARISFMKTYKISEIKDKRILGRNVSDAGKSDKALALFWAASALEINVKAKEVWVEFSSMYDDSEPWVSVYVNNKPVSRFMITKENKMNLCIARGLNPEKENLITIYKDTQPMSGEEHHSLFIHSISLNDEGVFCPLKERKIKLEVVGDSITSGEGLFGGPEEMEWIPQWFAGSRSYGAQVARSLDADFSLVSQCGWGLCWAWNGDIKGNMPSVYEKVCGPMWGKYQEELGASELYDFKGGSDFVVINLGTNDNGAFFQPEWKDESTGKVYNHSLDKDGKPREEDCKTIIAGVKNFLSMVRMNNPNAKILWVWGMIKLGQVPSLIKQGIEDYKKMTSDKDVYSMELDSMEDVEKTPEDKGSRGHPGPLVHALAAKKIAEFLKTLL